MALAPGTSGQPPGVHRPDLEHDQWGGVQVSHGIQEGSRLPEPSSHHLQEGLPDLPLPGTPRHSNQSLRLLQTALTVSSVNTSYASHCVDDSSAPACISPETGKLITFRELPFPCV